MSFFIHIFESFLERLFRKRERLSSIRIGHIISYHIIDVVVEVPSSSIPPDTIDDLHRKIREQEEKIIREFRSVDNCNNLFKEGRNKTRRDDVARRGYKARQILYNLNKKLNKQTREEDSQHLLPEICNLSPALDNLRLGGKDNKREIMKWSN